METLVKLLTSVCVLGGCFCGVLVQTSTGKILGKKINVLDRHVYAFFGIPYAVPPLGLLRFREPRPIPAWDDVLNATVASPICVQDPVFPAFEWVPKNLRFMSEDCLYLNVIVPADKTGDQPFATMVWIHGGGFNTGTANMDAHYGRFLSSIGNVIVVSMNYRLGIFGFLNLGYDNSARNMAMLDQVTALRWIHENVKNFGGDGNEITLFGSSVGSVSVGHHALSPLSRGLFRRVILQSGSNYTPKFVGTALQNIRTSEKIVERTACGSKFGTGVDGNETDVMSCLRELKAEELAAAERSYLRCEKLVSAFVPEKDGYFLPEDPIGNIEKGSIHRVKVMIGMVPDEGSAFLAYYKPEALKEDNPTMSKWEARRSLSRYYGINGSALESVVRTYLGNLRDEDYSGIFRRAKEAMGDGVLTCPIAALAEILSEYDFEVYRYTFDHARLTAGYKKWEGVSHFAEVYFVFGMPFLYPEKYTPREEELSYRLIQLWSSFAKDGKPRYPGMSEEWLPFDTVGRNTANLTLGDVRMVREKPKEECGVWAEAL